MVRAIEKDLFTADLKLGLEQLRQTEEGEVGRFGWYLQQIGQKPLLAHSQVKDLAKKVENGLMISKVRTGIVSEGLEVNDDNFRYRLQSSLSGLVWDGIEWYLAYPPQSLTRRVVGAEDQQAYDNLITWLEKSLPENQGVRKEVKDISTSLNILKSLDEKDSLEAAEKEGKDAREELILGNLRLVFSIAKQYARTDLDREEFIQEGNLGLIRAVEKFDHRRNIHISTYSTWWIRQTISRGIQNTSRIIRIPIPIQQIANRIDKAEASLYQALGRQPTTAELASKAGVSLEKVETIRRATTNPLSLDQTEDEESALLDIIQEYHSLYQSPYVNPEEYNSATSKKAAAERLLASLDERARRVIRLRFGINDGRFRTLKEVGEELGVTKERVRQIEYKAIRILRSSDAKEDREELLD